MRREPWPNPKGLSVYSPVKRRLLMRAPLNTYTGYGIHASYTARHFFNFGYDVRVLPLSVDESCFEELKDLVVKVPGADRSLLLAPPATEVKEREWFFTMHETTQLPKNLLDNVRRAEALLVPSTWSQQCFNAQGLDMPTFVVPIGVNVGYFYPAKKKPSLCVFGAAGNLLLSGPQRKNLELVILAFREAFRSEKDVRLKLKLRPECPIPEVMDDRVQIIREQMPEMVMADWYRSLTAYLSPSRCEAFGQMNLQAMACGVPVVCCAFGGVTDYHSERHGYNLDYAIVKPDAGYYSTGLWAEPDVDSLVEQMRRIYENRNEAEQKGVLARMVAQAYDWNRVTLKLESALKLGGFWQPLDRKPTKPVPLPEPKPAPVVTPPKPMPENPPPAPEPPRLVLNHVPNGEINLKSVWSNEAGFQPKKLPLWLARRTGGHEPVFYMSGDLGDILYSLTTIRGFGGGQLCVGPAQNNSYYWLREPMTRVRYNVIAPLLELQKSYLSRVFWSEEMAGWKCHVDLNDSRRLHREPYYVRERNLSDVASCYFGLGPGLWKEKWLVVDEPNKLARFVFARSQRYHMPGFPWKQIVEKHAHQAVFVGLPNEHAEFVAECGHVPFAPTNNLLELARIIAGAEWLVANQSCPMAVAEGLKIKILREHFAEAPNCIYPRQGHVDDPSFVLDLC